MCNSVVVLENEAQLSSRSERVEVSSQKISSLESDDDCSLICSSSDEEFVPPSSNKFKQRFSRSSKSTLGNKMKRFASSSSYCSSSEESCFSKSPDFPNRKDTFCSNSGYESIEVVSSLETI